VNLEIVLFVMSEFCSLVLLQGQGMISLAHIGKNVDAAELGGYVDAVLDACCQNTASDDEIWHLVVEASVVLVTLTQRNNPRSPWYIHPFPFYYLSIVHVIASWEIFKNFHMLNAVGNSGIQIIS